MRIAFIDTETLGLEKNTRIIQLAMIIADSKDLGIFKSYNMYFKLRTPVINPDAFRVNGINPFVLYEIGESYIEDSETFIINALKDVKEIIGQNPEFDIVRLINNTSERLEEVLRSCTVTDILYMSKEIDPQETIVDKSFMLRGRNMSEHLSWLLNRGYTMEEIRNKHKAVFFNVTNNKLHDASFDTLCTYLTYAELLKEKG